MAWIVYSGPLLEECPFINMLRKYQKLLHFAQGEGWFNREPIFAIIIQARLKKNNEGNKCGLSMTIVPTTKKRAEWIGREIDPT